jgi:hypothetical protein
LALRFSSAVLRGHPARNRNGNSTAAVNRLRLLKALGVSRNVNKRARVLSPGTENHGSFCRKRRESKTHVGAGNPIRAETISA